MLGVTAQHLFCVLIIPPEIGNSKQKGGRKNVYGYHLQNKGHLLWTHAGY